MIPTLTFTYCEKPGESKHLCPVACRYGDEACENCPEYWRVEFSVSYEGRILIIHLNQCVLQLPADNVESCLYYECGDDIPDAATVLFWTKTGPAAMPILKGGDWI